MRKNYIYTVIGNYVVSKLKNVCEDVQSEQFELGNQIKLKISRSLEIIIIMNT